ncbi:Chitin deacetylase [Mycena indigotica]|uniref:chitin deacetylase n=1 Tax=Mycena indigotica TaxID=2126181 RepID=A0A8H6SXH4_9AGAR|nr:Chitin deacetylase [Mycena indigotica]KAF7306607.1 Chitin deacetylase [Mycena indigotica]
MKATVVISLVAVAASEPLQARQSQAPASGSAGLTSGAAAPPQSSFPFSLATTNPTAVPLASIVSNAPSQATTPLPTTFAAGATPTALKGAPPLPNAAALVPSNYPALDVIVPTNSPEVQQWIREVNSSGITIPNIAPTVAGGCPANAQAAADTSRCWWTCGGCVAPSDITTCPQQLSWGAADIRRRPVPLHRKPAAIPRAEQPQVDILLGRLAHNFVAPNHAVPVHDRPSNRCSHASCSNLQRGTRSDAFFSLLCSWSHPSLTTLTNEQIIGELGWSKKIIKDTLGVTPTHFRPPFGDIDNRVRAIAAAMNLQPVIWTRISPLATFDTDDFDLHSGASTPSKVLQNWDYIKGNATTFNSGFILLEHDLFQQSVDIATGYILPDALVHQPKFNIAPVITCLNKPMEDAYIETNDNSTNPIASGGAPALSSGAPGSAQATSGGGGSGSNTGNAAFAVAAPVTVLSLTFALIAGFICA